MARTAPGVKRTHLLRGVTLYKIEKETGATQRVWQYGDFIAHEYDALRREGWSEWVELRNGQGKNSRR